MGSIAERCLSILTLLWCNVVLQDGVGYQTPETDDCMKPAEKVGGSPFRSIVFFFSLLLLGSAAFADGDRTHEGSPIISPQTPAEVLNSSGKRVGFAISLTNATDESLVLIAAFANGGPAPSPIIVIPGDAVFAGGALETTPSGVHSSVVIAKRSAGGSGDYVPLGSQSTYVSSSQPRGNIEFSMVLSNSSKEVILLTSKHGDGFSAPPIVLHPGDSAGIKAGLEATLWATKAVIWVGSLPPGVPSSSPLIQPVSDLPDLHLPKTKSSDAPVAEAPAGAVPPVHPDPSGGDPGIWPKVKTVLETLTAIILLLAAIGRMVSSQNK